MTGWLREGLESCPEELLAAVETGRNKKIEQARAWNSSVSPWDQIDKGPIQTTPLTFKDDGSPQWVFTDHVSVFSLTSMDPLIIESSCRCHAG
jgi:hypothetical protein